MEVISQYSHLFGVPFAFIALIYLITICLCFDSTKRTYATQMFLTVLNVLLVICSYLTDSTFLLVMWLVCLCINGYTLREIRSKKED